MLFIGAIILSIALSAFIQRVFFVYLDDTSAVGIGFIGAVLCSIPVQIFLGTFEGTRVPKWTDHFRNCIGIYLLAALLVAAFVKDGGLFGGLDQGVRAFFFAACLSVIIVNAAMVYRMRKNALIRH